MNPPAALAFLITSVPVLHAGGAHGDNLVLVAVVAVMLVAGFLFVRSRRR